MSTEALERDLSALVARYGSLTGRQFVAAALRVAEGFFERDDLPALADVRELADALRRGLA